MISILAPTRGRPANMKKVVESARATATNFEFVFYIDSDDTPSKDMADTLGVKYVVGERIVLSQMWNEAYKVAVGDIIMHGGDDLIFRTNGWDSAIENELKNVPDKILFVYCDDGYTKTEFGTHGFVHRNWIDVVGYFVPPYFSSDYNDTWLNDVADMIGRKKKASALIEHMHPVCGKAEWDITHMERLGRHSRDNVAQLYEDKKAERIEDARKLNLFIKEFSELSSECPSKYDKYYFTGRRNGESYWNNKGIIHTVQGFAYRYIMEYSNKKLVADIGCGMGFLTFKLLKKGIACVGIDPYTEELFKEQASRKGVNATFINGGLNDLPKLDFDTIVFCEAVEHIAEEEWDRNENKLIDILKKNNGILIIVNWVDNHPIHPDNTGFDHIRVVDDTFFDHLCAFGKVLVRNGSHLVIKFKENTL
jgi:2-polyprenyl-3-methyl-5-hydroxy-6-metoxy-1,4-benzoquinol methylase